MNDRKRRTLSKSSDYLDALATTLRDLGGPTTIPHELTQNADDAGNATTIRFAVSDNALTVWNDGTFSDCGEDGDRCPCSKRCDLHAFRQFAGRTKASDATTTGAFGVGFTSVYQITDTPELLYADEHWILNEMAPEGERLRACNGQCGRTHGEPGTTFVLPWARSASPLRHALAVPPVRDGAIMELEKAMLDDARAMLLFLQRINSVEVITPMRRYKVVRDQVENGVVIRDGTTITRWITLTADFAPDAQPVIARAAGLITQERPTTVTIALPADSGITSGVLYATLPTQTSSGLPGHVNASFYPRTDRKTVRFETGYDSDWNRAAIAAVASGLAGSATGLAEALGIPAFWEFLGAITDLDKRADPEQPNHAATYLEALREVVPEILVVATIDGGRERPSNALLPADAELYDSADALAKAGLPIVARHLHRRLYTNSVYTSYEISVLTARHVVERLKSTGGTETFNPDSGPFTLDDMRQILKAFDRLPGKVANVDGIGDVAIVPCRNGMVAPPSQVVWAASEDEAAMFELLVDGLLIADAAEIESLCPGLREVCPQLDVGRAARILESVDASSLAALSDELLDWLNRNLPAIDDTSRALLSALPIFRTATGSFAPLTTLSLPEAFHDPINVASLVDEATARDYRKLLTTLGARPLDVVDYFRVHVLPAAVEQRLSPDQAVQLLQLVAIHQVQLRDLRDDLEAAPLVPCLDGRLHPAHEAHFPSRDIAVLAPELPTAVTEGVAPVVLEWLGVLKAPTNRALATAVQRLALAPEDPDPAVAETVLRTLAARYDARYDPPESPPEFLTSQRWLPLKRGGSAKPSEVLPTNARHLYGTQGSELGLAADVQTRYFSQLTWLGMPAAPPTTTVLAHLKHCAKTGTEMSQDVYRVLSNNVDHPAVKQLKSTPCIQVSGGRFVSPSMVFWQQTPFGRWSTTLPEPWLTYKPFFDAVGVKNEPGPAEIAAILRAILDEFGTDHIDPSGETAIHGCWTRLSDMLEYPEASEVLAALGRIRSTLDPRGLLSRPDGLFFEDSRALHKRFPLLAHNVIPRVHGTWPALTEAGVQRVEKLIKAKLLDVETHADSELSERIANRMSALRRVLDDDDVLEELQHLDIQRTLELNVVYRAELFGYSYEVGPESVDAIYLPEAHELAYGEGASDRALARELARAIAPDDDPGALAMRLEPILSARSAEDAHHALDDFGIAKLDTTEHEAAWSPTAEAGDDLAGSDASPDIESTDTDDWGDTSGGAAGDNHDNETGPTPDPDSGNGGMSGAGTGGQQPRTGDRRPGDGRIKGASERKKAGSADPRTGRQTRLRSYVVETDENEGDRGTVGDEAPDLSPIDMAGVARVLEHERKCGREPREMAHSNAGFDVGSFDKRRELVRRIEVKSTGGQWSIAGVMLSRRQHHQAVEDGDLFWLYVVENAQDDDYKIYRIQNPASRIDYFGFDGGWKDVAEPDLERDEAGTPTAHSTRRLLNRSPGQSPWAG
ncbi:MAG TPA: DUF3883 domain-containing protein [Streptosporangiaceae bacterium]|nr:DUF3883 domain-containing protein [Streptosporangiaceae bacterium]